MIERRNHLLGSADLVVRWGRQNEALRKPRVAYSAPGVRQTRSSIEAVEQRPDGRKRPLGIAALEDKIFQQAMVWVLQEIYEVDFLGFSYGFRPGRNCHNALDAVSVVIKQRKVNWVLDADIQGFFDALDHQWLLEFLKHRIADPRVLKLIERTLKAGVIEDGQRVRPRTGSPQGAVISPLLAKIYLHYVLDLWVNWWRGKHARGEVYIIRYADDFLMCFQYREDAERMRKELTTRLQKFGLELHKEKTRLIEFGRFAEGNRKKRGEGKPESFDFLGFTHICSKGRKSGKYFVRRKSIKKRIRANTETFSQVLPRQ